VPFSSSDDPDGMIYERLSLNEDVKDLSLDAMAALLKSDHLDQGVGNEAYYLLGAWIYQCPHLGGGDERGGSEKTQLAKRTEAFKILAVFSNLST
jgi:hypothetical protein